VQLGLAGSEWQQGSIKLDIKVLWDCQLWLDPLPTMAARSSASSSSLAQYSFMLIAALVVVLGAAD
jgi:hypothetical protein